MKTFAESEHSGEVASNGTGGTPLASMGNANVLPVNGGSTLTLPLFINAPVGSIVGILAPSQASGSEGSAIGAASGRAHLHSQVAAALSQFDTNDAENKAALAALMRGSTPSPSESHSASAASASASAASSKSSRSRTVILAPTFAASRSAAAAAAARSHSSLSDEFALNSRYRLCHCHCYCFCHCHCRCQCPLHSTLLYSSLLCSALRCVLLTL